MLELCLCLSLSLCVSVSFFLHVFWCVFFGVCVCLCLESIGLKIKLTLRGLSLFLKMFPISNTCISAAYILATVQFLYPKHGSFSDLEYNFYQPAYQDTILCFTARKMSQLPTRMHGRGH